MRKGEQRHDWFARAKGCGDVRPTGWRGWLALAVYGLAILAAAPLAERTIIGFAAILVVATSLLLALVHSTTTGGLAACFRKGGKGCS